MPQVQIQIVFFVRDSLLFLGDLSNFYLLKMSKF